MACNVTVTSTATIQTVTFTIIVYNNKSYSYTVNKGTTWTSWVGSGRTLNTTKITIATAAANKGYVWYSRETASGSTMSNYMKAGSKTGSNVLGTSEIAANTYYC